ncbi:MAG: glycosyltransferase family 4 protein [Proteobacteria bacterium]|nr:glycosyltransferase family 4 protein [Pseudomonadota bacterium]
MKRILYIQHANAMGGSALSLLYLMQKLDRSKYLPVVACVSQLGGVIELYRSQGIETFYWPGIAIFPHTTGGWYPIWNPRALVQLAKTISAFPSGVTTTRKLIQTVKPDLVHLNSVVLAPCAMGVNREKIPFVWHVREAVVPGHLGCRRALIEHWLVSLPDEIIFISSDERHQLLNNKRGVVIPNFVDFDRFNQEVDGSHCRRELGFNDSDYVVLFLGGLGEIKGIHPFLEAIRIEHDRNPRLHAVIASGISPQSTSWLARTGRFILPRMGNPTTRQRAMAFMQTHQMQAYVHLLPFRADVERLIAACNVLVFPSVEPHFARPVIEAGAMGKPVIGSRIGGVEELVEDGTTGILVPPGNARSLADALHALFVDPAMALNMGCNGHRRARLLYNADINAKETIQIYDRIFNAK